MSPSLPQARYERKFLPGSLTLAEVLAAVRRHPAIFQEVYSERVVNNVYFDRPGLLNYRHHVEGTADRVKHRVRWYSPSREPGTCVPPGEIPSPRFECKIKRGTISGKQAFALPPLRLSNGVLNGELQGCFGAADLPPVLREELRQTQPVLYNRYRRRYFQSGDSRFRLTVDYALDFARADRGWNAALAPVRSEVGCVLELKYDPGFAGAASGVANGFPFRLTRCSKYVLGVELLGFV